MDSPPIRCGYVIVEVEYSPPASDHTFPHVTQFHHTVVSAWEALNYYRSTYAGGLPTAASAVPEEEELYMSYKLFKPDGRFAAWVYIQRVPIRDLCVRDFCE
jgi:hypothetical protein